MRQNKGFAPIILIIPILVLIAISGYLFIIKNKSTKTVEPKKEEVGVTPVPNPTQTLTPTPTPVPIVTTVPSPTLAPRVHTTIKIHTFEVSVCASEPINCFDPSIENPIRLPDRLTLRVVNLDTKEQWEVKNQVDYTTPNLVAGRYRASVYYNDPYAEKAANCEGCRNNQGIGESRNCGYTFDLQKGDNVRLVCKLNNYADPIKSNYSYPR